MVANFFRPLQTHTHAYIAQQPPAAPSQSMCVAKRSSCITEARFFLLLPGYFTTDGTLAGGTCVGLSADEIVTIRPP